MKEFQEKWESLQCVLSHEAIVGRPTKLQVVKNEGMKIFNRQGTEKRSVIGFSGPSVSNFHNSSVGLLRNMYEHILDKFFLTCDKSSQRFD